MVAVENVTGRTFPPLRPWNDKPIRDCGELLTQIPLSLHRLEPHPYACLGAPYGVGADPFCLRSGVNDHLLSAQDQLQLQHPELRLAIFDAWRPIPVQAFMVEHAISEECRRRGLSCDLSNRSTALQEVIDVVGRFWAPPSLDPLTPPPHSTGAAVDLTLADSNGMPLDMGGEIDAIGDISEPNYYAEAAIVESESEVQLWHYRRRTLAEAMLKVGFCQHPNEWWHFSFGDQLWAWSNGIAEAFYGAWPEPASKSSTACSPSLLT